MCLLRIKLSRALLMAHKYAEHKFANQLFLNIARYVINAFLYHKSFRALICHIEIDNAFEIEVESAKDLNFKSIHCENSIKFSRLKTHHLFDTAQPELFHGLITLH